MDFVLPASHECTKKKKHENKKKAKSVSDKCSSYLRLMTTDYLPIIITDIYLERMAGQKAMACRYNILKVHWPCKKAAPDHHFPLVRCAQWERPEGGGAAVKRAGKKCRE